MTALELARRYRPARFADFAGQRATVAVLYRMVVRDALPPVLMLHGERGCGKTSMARVLAKALNCSGESRRPAEWPCGQCASCAAVDAGISIDVEEVDAASNGSVSTIREIRDRAGYGTAGNSRVFILDEAHAASGPAFEAMLKTLEEPLPGVVFILVTTKPGAVPRTVRDRCLRFRFVPLPPVVIRARLEHICAAEQIEAELELLSAIADAARGGMRDAINLLEQVAAVKVSTLAQWRQLTGKADYAPSLLEAAASGDRAAMLARLKEALACEGDPGQVTGQLVRCLADVLVLTTPGGLLDAGGEELAARHQLAARLGAAGALGALQVLWDLQARVRTGDREADLILAMAMVSKKLCPVTAETIAPGTDSRSAIARLREELGAPAHGGPV